MPTDRADQDPDLAAHARTYHRFMLGLKWIAIHTASVLAFLIVAFATPAGIISGVLAGIVVFGAGIFAMTHGLAHSSEAELPSSESDAIA
ncbi:MAG TPA: aa3-type cytochrome c oxidase subunit IV [Caulobacteraceae bacterium]|jgi:hypothetical protein|nr:aa3-type cytochrome c oxidase subunit IV [Caulobacteraceae bacterium]